MDTAIYSLIETIFDKCDEKCIENDINKLSDLKEIFSQEDLTAFVDILSTKEDTEKWKHFYEEISKSSFAIKVLKKRIKLYHTFTLSQKVEVILCIISERVGDLVIYSNYLQYWCHKNQVSHIDIGTLCQKIFPMGFLSKDYKHIVWESQKVTNYSFIQKMIDNEGLLTLSNVFDLFVSGASLRKVKPEFDNLYAIYALIQNKIVIDAQNRALKFINGKVCILENPKAGINPCNAIPLYNSIDEMYNKTEDQTFREF